MQRFQLFFRPTLTVEWLLVLDRVVGVSQIWLISSDCTCACVCVYLQQWTTRRRQHLTWWLTDIEFLANKKQTGPLCGGGVHTSQIHYTCRTWHYSYVNKERFQAQGQPLRSGPAGRILAVCKKLDDFTFPGKSCVLSFGLIYFFGRKEKIISAFWLFPSMLGNIRYSQAQRKVGYLQ